MSEIFIKRCVDCGSNNLVSIKKNVELRKSNPGLMTIPKVKQVQCQNCGECYFDDEQMTKLSAAIDKKLGKK